MTMKCMKMIAFAIAGVLLSMPAGQLFGAGDFIAVGAESQGLSIDKGMTYAYPGETFAFTIPFSGCEGVIGYDFTFTYDTEHLEYLDGVLLDGVGTISVLGDTIYVSATNSDGFSDGDALTLNFKACSEPGNYYIYLDDLDFTYEEGGGVASAYTTFSIRVSEYTEEYDDYFCYRVYRDHVEVELNRYAGGDIVIPATYNDLPVTEVLNTISTLFIDSIAVDADNPYFCAKDGVLFDADGSTLVMYPMGSSATTYTVPDTVTAIRENAFYTEFYQETSLAEIIVPATVTTMEENAINLIRTAVLLSGVSGTAVHTYAMQNYYLFRDLESGVLTPATVSGSCGENLTWLLDGRGALTISGTGEMTLFEQQKNCAETPWWDLSAYITSVEVQEGVTSVTDCAFTFCEALTDVTLADTVTTLGYEAFYQCTALERVQLSASLETIGSDAFSGAAITEIVFPASLRSISDYAFGGCQALESVQFSEGLETVGYDAFYGCTMLDSVTLPDSIQELGEQAFGWENSALHAGFVIYSNCNPVVSAYTLANNLAYVATDATPGDVLADGTLDSDDAVLVLRYYAESLTGNDFATECPFAQFAMADINEDGVADPNDAVMILQLYAESLLAE